MRLALCILALIGLVLALLGLLVTGVWFPGYFHGGGLGALAPFLASLLLLAATVAATLALDVLAIVAAIGRRQWGWLAAVPLVTVASATVVYLAYAPASHAGSQAATPGATLEYRMAAYHAFLASFAALLAPPLVGLAYSVRLDRGRSHVAGEREAAHGLLVLSICNFWSLVLVATVQPFPFHGSAALWFSRFIVVCGLLIWLLGLELILMACVLAFRRRERGWFWGLLGAVPLGMLALPMRASPMQHLLIALVYSLHALAPIAGFILYLKLGLVTLALPLVTLAYAIHAVHTPSPPAAEEAPAKPA